MSVDVAVIESRNGNVAIVNNATPVAISSSGTNFAIANSGSGITAIISRGEPGPPGGVNTVFGRAGNVTALFGDYSAFYQPLDSDLTAFSGLAPATGQFLAYGSTAWESRGLIAADIPNLPASKITSGVFSDIQIPGSIARDSEVAAAIAEITAASIGALTQATADTRYTKISEQDFKLRAWSGYLKQQDPPTKIGSKITQIVFRTIRLTGAPLLTIDYTYTSGGKVATITFTDHRRLTAGDSGARIKKHFEPSGEVWSEVIV
jgi:hypothetical protein